MILDEPTAGLDTCHQIFISSPIHRIAVTEDTMVIIISRNLNVASMFANNVVLISLPEIVKQIGTAYEVITETNVSDGYNLDYEMICHKGRLTLPLDPEPH